MRRCIVLTLSACLCLGAVGGPAVASDSKSRFRLTSSAFANNGTIPIEYTCRGEGTSPPLAWKGVPKGTKELALIMEDPDTRIGTFVHWVVAAIKPTTKSIRAGTEPKDSFGGNNGVGRPGYGPPCPPAGPPHHYIFTLYALKKKVQLPPGATAATLRDAIRATTLGEIQLVGLFGV